MKKVQARYTLSRLNNKKRHIPLSGQIELTYRCNLNCIHCYCQDLGCIRRELTTKEWMAILDMLQTEGCLYLTFTGGEPLVREDFLEIYAYAKRKGFMITLFTNGQALTAKLINYLVKSPPSSMEITLNGISQKTYEFITQVPGSFVKVMNAIKQAKEKKIPFILKTNCLKQNKSEIVRIKAFTEELFAKLPRNRHRFKYSPLIYPKYNRDKTPCNYRLTPADLLEVKRQDPDIWREYQMVLVRDLPKPKRDREFLYRCNSWRKNFFINPYGYLKFCALSDRFSVNLKDTTLRDGFYNVFPKLLDERFKTNSKCKDCRLRPFCYYCPARAYLEAGDEEGPVEYYCQLAQETKRQKELSNCVK